MVYPVNALVNTTAAIAAIAGLGTAAAGLVDATKVFWGGISNLGFGSIENALKPFKGALDNAETNWVDTIRANWINGAPKDDQKAAAKSLIRLGLSSTNAAAMASAGHVDATRLTDVLKKIETGAQLAPEDVTLLGRFNAAIEVAMDTGFERADQVYRNAAKFCAGLAAVGLAVWAGALLRSSTNTYFGSTDMWMAVLTGVVAVPLAPVAKDLTSALQAAAGANKSVKG